LLSSLLLVGDSHLCTAK